MSERACFIRCIRPFEEVKCSKELRNISNITIQKLKSIGYSEASGLNTGFRICTSCRLRVDKQALFISNEEQHVAGSSKMPTTVIVPVVPSCESLTTVPSMTSVTSVQSYQEFTQPVNIEIFNRGIAGIQVSPIDVGKLNYIHYPEKKHREINEGIRKNLFNFEPEADEVNELKEVLENMKEKFSNASTARSEKLLILSLLPYSWSTQKVMDQFNASRYIATEAKLIKEGHSSKTAKYGTALSDETKLAVIIFF